MKIEDMTIEQLTEEMRKLDMDPASLNPGLEKGTSIYLYTRKARAKMDRIARAITDRLSEKRKAEGRKVVVDGYSGRQTNRAR